jgi:hypothetical protein
MPVIKETFEHLPQVEKPTPEAEHKLIMSFKVSTAIFYALFVIILKACYIH